MKTVITLTILCILSISMAAQTPQAFKYQAVARNASGEVLVNQSVSFRISIIKGSVTGAIVYTETHKKTTNAFGLVDLEIGRGTPVTGIFSSITWGNDAHYINIELDPSGGTVYQFLGASQLLSVPYSLYSKDVLNKDDADADPSNELQKISISGTVLTLDKNGGSVTLPSSGTGGDNWGTQAVVTDATLAGTGTPSSPMKIAQQSAASGQVLKWDGATWKPSEDLSGNGLWQPNGTKIYYNNGYVGIGIADPVRQLHVHSPTLSSGIQFTNDVSGSTSTDGFIITQQYQSETENHYALVMNNENTPLRIGANKNYTQLVLNPDGNVGVGSISSDAKFQVSGQVRIFGGNPGTGKVLTSDATGLASWQTLSSGLTLPYAGSVSIEGTAFHINNSNLGGTFSTIAISGHANKIDGIGVFGSAGQLTGACKAIMGTVNSPEGYSGYFAGGKFYINSNVGIGNENPGAKLDVNGQIKITGGNPGAGKVLTSDASGLASWQIGGWTLPFNGISTRPGAAFSIKNAYTGEETAWGIIAECSQPGGYALSASATAASGSSTSIHSLVNSPTSYSGYFVGGRFFVGGNVGLNVLEPSAKLDIDGQVRIRGGSPGAGKVLTTDATGLASWQPVSLTLPFEGSVFSDGVALSVQNTSTNGGVAAIGISGTTNNAGGTGVLGYARATSGTARAVVGDTDSPNGYSGYFEGGRFYVQGNVGIGKTDPTYKLDVTGNRIRLTEPTDPNEWIALRTDGATDILDLSYSGGELFVQGSNDGESILLSPTRTANKVGIHTWDPVYDLDVIGNIRATGAFYVGGTDGSTNGTPYPKPDFVFNENYDVLNTEQVADFLKVEKHLPWITSAEKEKEENGEVVNFTRMAFETLEAVENLQLQLIKQNKLVQELYDENDRLKERLEKLEKLVRASSQK